MEIETKFDIGQIVQKPSGFLDRVQEIDITVYNDGSQRVTYYLSSGQSFDEPSLYPDKVEAPKIGKRDENGDRICDHCDRPVFKDKDFGGELFFTHGKTGETDYWCWDNDEIGAEWNGTDVWSKDAS